MCENVLATKHWYITIQQLLPWFPTNTAFSGIWISSCGWKKTSQSQEKGATNGWWWKDNKWACFGELTFANLRTTLPTPFHVIWWDNSKIDSACSNQTLKVIALWTDCSADERCMKTTSCHKAFNLSCDISIAFRFCFSYSSFLDCPLPLLPSYFVISSSFSPGDAQSLNPKAAATLYLVNRQ